MPILLMALLLLAGLAFGQQDPSPPFIQVLSPARVPETMQAPGLVIDRTGLLPVVYAVSASGAAIPAATCQPGQVYVRTGVAIDDALYICLGDRTWAKFSGGGGGSGSGTVSSGESGCLAVYPSSGTTIDDAQNGGSVCGIVYDPDANTLTFNDSMGVAKVTISGENGSVDAGSVLKISGGVDSGAFCGNPSATKGCLRLDSTSKTLIGIDDDQNQHGTVRPKTCPTNTFVSAVDPTASGDTETCSAPTRTVNPMLPGANCGYTAGGTICGTGFYAVGACPTPTAVTGTNTGYGVLQYPDSDGDCDVQTSFPLSGYDGSTISLSFIWRSSQTSGDVVFQAATACVAIGETGDPSFNSFQTVTDTAAGSANQWNVATIASLTTTGCVANEIMFLKLRRNRTHASDSITGTPELLFVQPSFNRSL